MNIQNVLVTKLGFAVKKQSRLLKNWIFVKLEKLSYKIERTKTENCPETGLLRLLGILLSQDCDIFHALFKILFGRFLIVWNRLNDNVQCSTLVRLCRRLHLICGRCAGHLLVCIHTIIKVLFFRNLYFKN